MSSLMSKITSLKKVINDLNMPNDSKEKEILLELSNIVYEITEKVEKMEKSQSEINEYVTILDENLGNIEDELYGFEEDDEEFSSYDYIDIQCNECNAILAIEKSLMNNENELICPNCRNTIKLKSN